MLKKEVVRSNNAHQKLQYKNSPGTNTKYIYHNNVKKIQTLENRKLTISEKRQQYKRAVNISKMENVPF